MTRAEFIQQVIVARSVHGGGIADAIRTAVAYATHLERSEEAPWSREPDSCIEAGEAEAIRLAERVRVSNLFSTWLCLDHGGEEEARIRERILTAPREDARKEEI